VIRLAVRRPVATLTATAAVAVLGAVSLARMPLELLPEVTLPRLSIHAAWPGASPEMVEGFVTAPIEAAVQGVRGVESVASTSYAERATITVEFERRTDMEFARLELSERVAALARSLPPGAEHPVVEPYVPEAFAAETQALLGITLAGPATLGGLRELALERVRPALLAAEGIDAVDVVGGTERELELRLDPARLAARGLAPDAVRRAISAGVGASESGGTLRRGGREWTVAVDDHAAGPADIEKLVVRPDAPKAPAVRIADLGRVGWTYADARSHYRVDGLPAVSLFVYPEAGSNEIRVAGRARERIAGLARLLPASHRLIIDRDRTEPIREELTSLRDRALISAAVVFLVLLVAFRRLPPTALAFGSIAASILATLVLLWIGGLSLNLLTLAGLATGLGLVVDNAIVVLESVESRRAGGERAALAAWRGTRQVALPMLAATATTLIVFLPFLYVQGELRAYYVPFAWTVAAILAVSLAVSLTAVPTVAARLERAGTRSPGSSNAAVSARSSARPHGVLSPRRGYRAVIGWTLRHPKVTVALVLLALLASGWLFWERVPQGREWGGFGEETYLSIQIEMPPGSELEHTDAIARGLEERLARIPAIERFTTRVEPEFGFIRVTFPDSLATTWVPLAIKERMVAHSHEFGGAEVRVYGFGPSFYGGGGGPPSYAVKLLGYDYRGLERLALDLAARLRRFARIRDVDPNASGRWFERDKETELVLAPDRARLAAHGLSVAEFLDHATAAVHGRVARDRIEVRGEEIPLDVKLEGAEEADVQALLGAILVADEEGIVRIADVADVRPRETLGRIIREDQQYQRLVAWEFRGPPKLGDRVRDAVLATTVLPPGYELEKETSWWEFEEGEARQLSLVVGFALALVYLVTAALFESLRAPLVVLASVPLALVGVFILYMALGETFTREAWIGVVMMSGIVVNNAILVVDRIGALARGQDGPPLALHEAALEGTLDRVRPVLMTSATTVVGLLPLVVGAGDGASSLWRALALVTIAGLVSSTLLVLTTIPALYVLMSPQSVRRRYRVDLD
jgi:HAE1 family hydrophobic/amphiphilic exporter-1